MSIKTIDLINAEMTDCLQSFADLSKERAALDERRALIYEKYKQCPNGPRMEWFEALIEELEATEDDSSIISEKGHELAVRLRRLQLEMALISKSDKARGRGR